MRVRFIRSFAAIVLLLVGGTASAATLTLDYIAEVSDIDGSAAAIQILADAGIVMGADARGHVSITDSIADSDPGNPVLGIYAGAVTDFALSLNGVAATFDGTFADVYVNNDSDDIILATGAGSFGNPGLGDGLVGLQLRDSTGGAWGSDALPFGNMFNLADYDTYAPFDAEGTALLFSVNVGNELVFVYSEIKILQAKVVPLPGAVWLFGFALLSLRGLTRRG